MMIGALVLLVLVIATNYSMLGFVCHGLHVYGAWLNKNHKVDLWLLRVLVSITTEQYLHSHSTFFKSRLVKTERNIISICPNAMTIQFKALI